VSQGKMIGDVGEKTFSFSPGNVVGKDTAEAWYS
jgi:hypothetical protein